jgi:hypothetical protein
MTHDWRSLLIMRSDGSGIEPKSIQNAYLIVKNEPKFAGLFGIKDDLLVIVGDAPWTRGYDHPNLRETDITALRCELEYFGMTISHQTAYEVIYRIASEGK